jgi:hypothetical protein
MPSRRNPAADARRGITTPSTSRSPLFRPSQHGSRSRPSRPTWAHWLLPGALMCVTWSPICHSTRSERHMTQLSHVVASRVMWLSMRARSPSARSPPTRRCASTPLGPIGPRSRAEGCPPPTTPTVLAFSNRRPWSAAVGGTFCPVSSQGVGPYRRSIRSLQVARASAWSRAFRWDCSAWSRPSHRFVSGARIIAASVAGLPVRASSRHRPIRISAPPRGHTGMHARLSGACQAGTRGRRGPSVAVRGTADGAHRPSWRPDAVRYMSVDTATQRSTAIQGDTGGQEENGPDSRESAAIGPFPQGVAGIGFEPT